MKKVRLARLLAIATLGTLLPVAEPTNAAHSSP